MRRLGFALASVIGVALGASAAQADKYNVSGFVAINLGGTWSDYESDATGCLCNFFGHDDSTFAFGGQGRINVWLDKDMSLQLDAEGEGTTNIHTGQGTGDDGRTGGTFGAHISWREPSHHLIGFFGGFTGFNNLDYDGTQTYGILGAEAQLYSNDWTFYVQGGFAPLMSGSDDNEPDDLWFLRGVARYFVNPNDRLQAEFGFANGDIRNNTGEHNLYNWGASWEHRYAGTPFSNSIDYIGLYDDREGGAPNWAQEHIVQVSFKIRFGEDDLKEADREGATLDMPTFGRATVWSWLVGR